MENFCGKANGGQVNHNKTWWWNEVVNTAVKEKYHHSMWKQWTQGGIK